MVHELVRFAHYDVCRQQAGQAEVCLEQAEPGGKGAMCACER